MRLVFVLNMSSSLNKDIIIIIIIIIISMASFLWDICKQYSHRCDATERGVPSGAHDYVC